MSDRLDEFVSLFDDDDGFDDSGDEDAGEKLFQSYVGNGPKPGSATTTSKDTQEKPNLTYHDLFGSPIKSNPVPPLVKTKSISQDENEGIFSAHKRANNSKANDFRDTFQKPEHILGGRGEAEENPVVGFRRLRSAAVLPNSASNVLLMDPHSKLRLVRNSISIYSDEFTPIEKSLKDRNTSIPFLPLGNSAIQSSKNFWTTCVLVRKAGMRQSSKGNDYSIWEVNDLQNLEVNWPIFLFGSTATSSTLQSTTIGSVLDLINPNILDDSSSKKGYKFSLINTNQIRFIGKAQDYGCCEATRKDGKPCTVPVNTFTCPVCIHHASAELRKSLKKNKTKKIGNNSKPKPSFHFEVNQDFEWKRRKNEGVVTTDFFALAKSKASSLPKSADSAGFSGSRSGPTASTSSTVSVVVPNASKNLSRKSTRMELQDTTAMIKRNPIQLGNHSSISFIQDDKNTNLLSIPKCDLQVQQQPLKKIELDPLKTRHLTEKDRKIIEALSKGEEKDNPNNPKAKFSKLAGTNLPNLLATTTTAGARNVLQYFNAKNKTEERMNDPDEYDANGCKTGKLIRADSGALIMSRDTLSNMKKALNYVKQLGPIKKVDPNSTPKLCPGSLNKAEKTENIASTGKRKLSDDVSQPVEKSKITKTSSEKEKACSSSSGSIRKQQPKPNGISSSKSANKSLDFNTVDKSKLMQNEEFLKILNAKSSHANIAEDIKEEEYFNKLERREAIENKLLSTFSIPTSATMCRECKYIAVGQSDYCKEKRHSIKIVQAYKRFFQCKDCGQRTMSLDRLPKKNCSNCKNSNWIITSVGKERKGPLLESEVLSVRGDEEKFLGSSSVKQFINL